MIGLRPVVSHRPAVSFRLYQRVTGTDLGSYSYLGKTGVEEQRCYFFVYFSSISFMTSAAVLLPFRISCIISVDGGRI